MNEARLQLATRRGELKAQIAAQRATLAESTQPLQTLLGAADQVALGANWVKAHPGAVGAGALLLSLLRPRRAWRWGKRGLALWRTWRGLRQRFFGDAPPTQPHPGI